MHARLNIPNCCIARVSRSREEEKNAGTVIRSRGGPVVRPTYFVIDLYTTKYLNDSRLSVSSER